MRIPAACAGGGADIERRGRRYLSGGGADIWRGRQHRGGGDGGRLVVVVPLLLSIRGSRGSDFSS
jgi:hypothetical protein